MRTRLFFLCIAIFLIFLGLSMILDERSIYSYLAGGAIGFAGGLTIKK